MAVPPREAASPTRRSRSASARRCASELAEAREADLLVPQVVYGYFPVNGDGDDLIIWKDDDAHGGVDAVQLSRASGRQPYLCIADFFRPVESAEVDYAAFHIVTMGAEVSEETAGCSPRTATRTTCCCTASASRWPRRWPSTGTPASGPSGASATRTAPALPGLFRQQFRGGRYSWGYPACPDLEDNAKVAELLDADRIGVELLRGDLVAVPARADDLGHHLPPPPGQVLRRPLTAAPSRAAAAAGPRRYASAVSAGPAPAGRRSEGRARPP